MAIYFFILCFVVCLAVLAVWTPRCRSFALLGIFLTLTVPAAIRYGIGTDYLPVYLPTIESIQNGDITDQELSFHLIVRLCQGITESPQLVFAIYSILTYALVVYALRGKNLPGAISAYVLSYYTFSYNGIRQALAMACIMVAFDFFRRSKWIWLAVFSLAGVFFHTSAAIFIPMLFGVHCLQDKSSLKVTVIACVAIVFFFAVDLSSLILRLAAVWPKYGGYAEDSFFAGAAAFNSGLGILFRCVVYFTLFLVLNGADSRTARAAGLFCLFYVAITAVGWHLEIFRRFTYIADFILPFAVIAVGEVEEWRLRWAAYFVTFLLYGALFVKGIAAEDSDVSPYETVFSSEGYCHVLAPYGI